MRRAGGAAVVVLAMLTAGCARDRVILLPGEGDHPTGAVAVIDEEGTGDRGLIDTANSTARLAKSGAVKARGIDEVKVAKRYGTLIDALPEKEKGFILYFETGSTTLTAESRMKITDILAEFRRRDGAEVQIVGHTDSMGEQAANDALAKERAQGVLESLVAQGFPADFIRATGRGERDSAKATGDEVPSIEWRRVEVIVR